MGNKWGDVQFFSNNDSRYTSCVRTLQRVLFSMPGIMILLSVAAASQGRLVPALSLSFTRVTDQKMISPQISGASHKNLNQKLLAQSVKGLPPDKLRINLRRQSFPTPLNKIAVGKSFVRIASRA